MKSEDAFSYTATTKTRPFIFEINHNLPIPDYLEETYWWAYLHPKGVKIFDTNWVINSILFGNYHKLRNSVLDEINRDTGDILQLAAVYGNISLKIAEKINPQNRLSIVDIAPIQLQNLSKKITTQSNIQLIHEDITNLSLPTDSQAAVVLFFILHEIPDDKKAEVLQQALLQVQNGGKIIIVDYHKPSVLSPFRYLMMPVLALLEPFAKSLWRREIISWLPVGCKVKQISKETFFSGLYQKIVIEV